MTHSYWLMAGVGCAQGGRARDRERVGRAVWGSELCAQARPSKLRPSRGGTAVPGAPSIYLFNHLAGPGPRSRGGLRLDPGGLVEA